MGSLRRFSPADVEKLKFMASFGHDGKSIARSLGRTPQSVRVKAVEIGVRLRPPKMEHRRIKLSLQAWRALQTEADRLGTSADGWRVWSSRRSRVIVYLVQPSTRALGLSREMSVLYQKATLCGQMDARDVALCLAV